MKQITEIYREIIEPIRPYTQSGKLNKKQLEKFNRDLITLICGIVIGTDLVGDKIDNLAEQIKSLINNK